MIALKVHLHRNLLMNYFVSLTNNSAYLLNSFGIMFQQWMSTLCINSRQQLLKPEKIKV